MGRIAEEDERMAAQRRKLIMVAHAPCKDCPYRRQSEDGAKICETECELWQEYTNKRKEIAEKRKSEQYKKNYYWDVQMTLVDERRKKYGR